MKKLVPLILLGFTTLSCSSQTEVSQQTSILTKAVLIKEASAVPFGPCEPSIAISLADPSILVAGSILDRVYYSHNGGESWTTDDLQSPHGVWGDPVVISDTTGRFLFFHLSDPDGRNWASEHILDRIVCQWSDNGGEDWSEGSYMGLNKPKDQDKEWAVVNLETNEIYCTWTQFDSYGSEEKHDKSNILFASSTDRGESWSEPIQINQISGDCIDDDATTEGAVPAVGPNGEIYVAWALNEKIYFDRSLDGGRTWNDTDAVVAQQPGGWTVDIPGLNRSNGMPITVADVSDGPYQGRVYVCWADLRNGKTDMDIFFAYSDDQGSTWSEAIRINQDDSKKMQFLPWMVVDPVTGFVHVVYYDRRQHSDNATDVILATSTDGGETWTEDFVNRESFTPMDGVFFGDYNNITAYGGNVHPIWTEFRNMKLQVWTIARSFH